MKCELIIDTTGTPRVNLYPETDGERAVLELLGDHAAARIRRDEDDGGYHRRIKRLVLTVMPDFQALFSKFHPRAVKLLEQEKPFIVIANDEPYFKQAYDLIRKNEKAKGTWTEEDEFKYEAATKPGDQNMANLLQADRPRRRGA
jgi:hypothetical protein